MNECGYCGMMHKGVCSRVKAIEYEGDGVTVKRVEFHGPAPFYPPLQNGQFPQPYPLAAPYYGPSVWHSQATQNSTEGTK